MPASMPKIFLAAVDKVMLFTYDLAIIDITLPGGNGLEVIGQLKKQRPETGIIVLSAKNSLDDKITGLNLGADDYLTKPFQLSELNARIKAIIRRRNFDGKNEIRFNEISIADNSATALRHGRPVDLTKKNFNCSCILSAIKTGCSPRNQLPRIYGVMMPAMLLHLISYTRTSKICAENW